MIQIRQYGITTTPTMTHPSTMLETQRLNKSYPPNLVPLWESKQRIINFVFRLWLRASLYHCVGQHKIKMSQMSICPSLNLWLTWRKNGTFIFKDIAPPLKIYQNSVILEIVKWAVNITVGGVPSGPRTPLGCQSAKPKHLKVKKRPQTQGTFQFVLPFRC